MDMTGVNLIPAEVRTRQAVKRRLSIWAAVVAVSAASACIPVVVEGRRRAELKVLAARAEKVDQDLSQMRRKLTSTVRAVTEAEMQINRANALRNKRSWAGLLGVVSSCMPRHVWLTSFSTDPPAPSEKGRSPQATGRASPGEGVDPGVVVLEAPVAIEITGYALDHAYLYDFMSRLKGCGAFESVELLKSSTEPVYQDRAVRFVLNCKW